MMSLSIYVARQQLIQSRQGPSAVCKEMCHLPVVVALEGKLYIPHCYHQAEIGFTSTCHVMTFGYKAVPCQDDTGAHSHTF